MDIQFSSEMRAKASHEDVNADAILRTFLAGIDAISDDDRDYLTLDSIAALIGVDASSGRLIECVNILTKANVLEKRAQYVDAKDDVYDFDQAGYMAALEFGAFIDPASGLEIADTTLLAPYWAIPARLAA
ncbi:hypothetical protein KUV57_11915 [Epibacterium sp. DP7N7-1]|nr:hypothetical protein [Epibacterium sp. DP7N7-1]